MITIRKLCLGLLILLSPVSGAIACDVTIDPGTDISDSLSSVPFGGTLCLNDGVYTVTPDKQIILQDGKTIMGHSHDKTKVIIQGTFSPPPQQCPPAPAINCSSGAMIYMMDGPNGGTQEAILWVTLMGETENTPTGVMEDRPKYAINVNNATYPTISTVNISHVRIAITSSATSHLLIDQAYITNIGDIVRKPDGDYSSIAITNNSNYATINHSTIIGNNNGHVPLRPGANGAGTMVGDGQVTCNDSDHLQIRNTEIQYGGAGMYMVNCTNATVADDIIDGASAWGIDAPAWNNNLLVQNTTIENSGKGVSDFGAYWFPPNPNGPDQGWGHATAVFYQNTYINNKQIDFSLLPASMLINCDGVNVLLGPDPSGHSDPISSVTSTGNTDTGGTSRCAYTDLHP